MLLFTLLFAWRWQDRDKAPQSAQGLATGIYVNYIPECTAIEVLTPPSLAFLASRKGILYRRVKSFPLGISAALSQGNALCYIKAAKSNPQ